MLSHLVKFCLVYRKQAQFFTTSLTIRLIICVDKRTHSDVGNQDFMVFKRIIKKSNCISCTGYTVHAHHLHKNELIMLFVIKTLTSGSFPKCFQ